MLEQEFQNKVRGLIDGLKSVCANYGLSGDGNEYKIITQIFLYKFLNDKFAYEAKKADPSLLEAGSWELEFAKKSVDEVKMLHFQTGPDVARLEHKHLITTLYEQQNDADFSELFDDTLIDIATKNIEIFSVKTSGGEKDRLFDRLSQFITDRSDRNGFCKAIINRLVDFSFENIFEQKFDFYATIFEYLIKDYNTNSGGVYAEYYTPHAVSRIMANILVPEEERGAINNVSCYDPSAGSGTLLMSLAHAIGADRCAIFSQDISQKSSSLLRLNLILNSLVHSIPNVIKGNTILEPSHYDGKSLRKFDYIVSNPPFKTDFSDYQPNLDTKENEVRFFSGIPKIPAKKKESMAIYQLFLQHIIYSLKSSGKAAVVVPTGFVTSKSIDLKIRKKLIDENVLAGVVSMPSNIFATTGTNVSIVFIDKDHKGDVVLVDASNLGTKIKEGKNQKTLLSIDEECEIINLINNKVEKDDLSVLVSPEEIVAKDYSFSAGQYFDIKIQYSEITKEQFEQKIYDIQTVLKNLSEKKVELESEVNQVLKRLTYDQK